MEMYRQQCDCTRPKVKIKFESLVVLCVKGKLKRFFQLNKSTIKKR